MTLYKYCCVSTNGVQIDGIQPNRRIVTSEDRDVVIGHIMHSIAVTIGTSGVPFDPFNLKLIVQAQPEPKLPPSINHQIPPFSSPFET